MKNKMHLMITGVVAFILAFVSALYGQAPDTSKLANKLVSEVKALDEAIVSVRPAHVYEASQPRFKIQWMPAVTLKKDTSKKNQDEIAKKLTKYVVAFQGGVLTDDVYGGVLSFFEGEGWHPEIGQVVYRVVNRNPLTVEVWTQLNIINEDGSLSCCNEGRLIGHITGRQFK